MRLPWKASCVLVSSGLLLLPCGGTPDDTCDADNGCKSISGRSLLQARSGLNLHEFASEVEVVESEEEQVEVVESEEEEQVQTTEYEYAGATIREHSHCIKDSSGRSRWAITIKEGCTQDDIDKMKDHMPKGSTPDWNGDPDHGGLCVFIMNGTRDEVEEELRTHTWPHPPDVECDTPIQATAEMPNDPYFLQQSKPQSWGLDRIDDKLGLDESFNTLPDTRMGDGVNVYVLDTGVHWEHADFEGRAVPSIDVTSGKVQECKLGDTVCARDMQSHGTHCAGTVAGKLFGVAKKAKIHGVKVLGDSGGGSTTNILKAIDWVKKNHRKPAVISMSLGGSGRLQSVKDAVDAVTNSGITVVVAAGNQGHRTQPDACQYSPAFVPSAITVGSTDKRDSRSYFSSYGSCLDIFAPGTSIVSAQTRTKDGSSTKSGTSMACPHVAGAVALLLGKNASMTPKAVVTALKSQGSQGILTDVKAGSPNIMLYTGDAQSPKAPAGPPGPPGFKGPPGGRGPPGLPGKPGLKAPAPQPAPVPAPVAPVPAPEPAPGPVVVPGPPGPVGPPGHDGLAGPPGPQGPPGPAR